MTDQTGAEQQGAAGSRTGDVDVADEKRPDVTTERPRSSPASTTRRTTT